MDYSTQMYLRAKHNKFYMAHMKQIRAIFLIKGNHFFLLIVIQWLATSILWFHYLLGTSSFYVFNQQKIKYRRIWKAASALAKKQHTSLCMYHVVKNLTIKHFARAPCCPGKMDNRILVGS